MASKAKVQDPLRAIKIKTGVVKRLFKEKAMYEKEVVDNQNKLEQWEAEGKEAVYLKKQGELVSESKAMVKDCARRFNVAKEELTVLLDNESSLADTEEYKAAKEVLEQSKES